MLRILSEMSFLLGGVKRCGWGRNRGRRVSVYPAPKEFTLLMKCEPVCGDFLSGVKRWRRWGVVGRWEPRTEDTGGFTWRQSWKPFSQAMAQWPDLLVVNLDQKSWIFFFTFYSVLEIQIKCCDSFRWTAKGLSHIYTYIHSPPSSPPIQAATWHWAEFPVLHSRALLAIHFKYSSVYMSILNSLTMTSPHPSPSPVTISSFSKSVILSENLSLGHNLAESVPRWFPNLGAWKKLKSHVGFPRFPWHAQARTNTGIHKHTHFVSDSLPSALHPRASCHSSST